MQARICPQIFYAARAWLVVVFLATQVTALSHEFEHVLHRHDVPCALHVAADHLMMIGVPEPGPAVVLIPLASELSAPHVARTPLRPRSTAARAPPRPA
jgi:hypothetical protein